MIERGKYIVLEGGEGVGKSTQIRKLAGYLALRGLEVRTDIREPGGTPMGEALRTLIKDADLPREPETNLALFNTARIELQKRIIAPELAAGRWVICDRNRLSSHAYQGYGEGVDIDYVREECDKATRYAAPDLEMVLWVDEAERARRLQQRGGADYFENLDQDFHRRVLDGYAQEARDLGLPYIDGNGDESAVHARIREQIDSLIDNKGA